MPLDLTGLRPNLNELLLRDRCQIYRDVGGSTDDVTDPVTGSVIAGSQVVLGTFDCGLKTTYRNLGEIVGGQPRVIGFYELKLPAGTQAMRPGDAVKFTVCLHDPNVVGKMFRIEEALHSTLALFSKYRMELRQRIDDRP